MQTFENKPIDEWNDHDKLTFALAGLANVTTGALKDNLNPPYGWTDLYPERLLNDINFWVDKIYELKRAATLKYPKLEWVELPEGGAQVLADDFSLTTGYRQGGPDKGTWSAIMNGASLTSGSGTYGYNFDSMEAAKSALEQAMKDVIDARVSHAKQIIQIYA